MKKTFQLTLPMCPTDNHIYGQKGKIRFMYKEAKEWKADAQRDAKLLWKKKPLKEELWADITFYVARDRDVHGSGKLIMDSLQGLIYDDDKQFTHVSFHKMKDKENSRVHIVIGEI